MASGRCMSKTVEYIQSKSQGINPTVGIILGSGLGSFVNVLENPISLSYNELDGFPAFIKIWKNTDSFLAILERAINYSRAP